MNPICPQCSSPKLTFMEHGPGGAVYRCEECGRATIQRWAVTVPGHGAKYGPGRSGDR